MAAGIGTTSTIPPATLAFYDKVLLKRATPYLVHNKFGQKRPIPKGGGTQIKFRKYNAIAINKTPLGEGITPPIESITKTDLIAQLQQWGRRLGITDMVEFTTPDSIVTENVDILGEVMGETIDEIVRDVLLGCPSIYRAGNVALRNQIVTAPATTDLTRIERALKGANAKYFTEIIKAQTGFNTSPIAPAFWVIVHTDTIMNLRNLSGFISVQNYSNAMEAVENEVGSWGNFRFIATTKSSIVVDSGGTAVTNSLKYTTANTACDVYRSIVLAKDAYGYSDLSGEGLRTFIKRKGEGDDDMEQRTRVSAKATFTCRILNDSMMMIYEHGVSA